MTDFIRIVPGNGGKTASDTQAFDIQGNEIKGIHRIELKAEPGCLWEAVLYCYAEVDGELIANTQYESVQESEPDEIRVGKF